MSNSDNPTAPLKNLVNAALHNHIAALNNRIAANASSQTFEHIAAASGQRRAEEAEQGQQFWLEAANIARRRVTTLTDQLATANAQIEAATSVRSEDRLTLADWIVSQKAFKELAMAFGAKLGYDKQQVQAMGMGNKLRVLKNSTDFGNNAEDSAFIGAHLEALLAKLENKPTS